ncbi:MAG TPA: F0F1 ATP synthase subunit alpha, partial [Acidobacteriota bacterium]|nr:F0F1 ATP synthase subunit alpha [Acidobacteriota bacterium]
RELSAFAQFGSDLDRATQQQLARGARLTEILKQDQYRPLAAEKQIVVIFAGTNGFLDDLPIEQVRAFEGGLLEFMETNKGDLLATIREKGELDDELREKIQEAITDFKTQFKEQQVA